MSANNNALTSKWEKAFMVLQCAGWTDNLYFQVIQDVLHQQMGTLLI